MANKSRAVLESVLRAHQLDRTLTTSLPEQAPRDSAAVVPFGLEALDVSLAGGVPRGQLSTIAGSRSSGRTTLLLQLLGTATRRGEWVALVDTFDRADVESFVRAGLVQTRCLWIRGRALSDASAIPGRVADAMVARALKSWHLVLQAGGFGAVALDLGDVPPAVLARIPFTTWLRVQRAIEGSEIAGVVLATRPIATSAGGVALLVEGTPRWTGVVGRNRRFEGIEVRVRGRASGRLVAVEARVTVEA
jgi:hypothetical protein